jgi:hypothetical protein
MQRDHGEREARKEQKYPGNTHLPSPIIELQDLLLFYTLEKDGLLFQ